MYTNLLVQHRWIGVSITIVKCGRTSNVPDADEPGTYSMEDANNIRDLIVQNGVLTRIEHNPVVASSLMKSVTLKVIKHCRDISE